VKALLLITQTMPSLEHIYLKAPCQPSNPVLGGSLILLMTSCSEVLSFLEIKQPLVPVFFFFGNSVYTWFFFFFFFFWGEFSQPGDPKKRKKGAGESNNGILETFKNKFAIS
jgi:hypothetical protein